MPGSLTAPGRVGTRGFAPSHVAFRVCDHVSTRIKNISRLNGWPVHTPCQRFATRLAACRA